MNYDFSQEQKDMLKWSKAIEEYMSIKMRLKEVSTEIVHGVIVATKFSIETDEELSYSELNDACLNTAFQIKRGRRFWWISIRNSRELILQQFPYYLVDGRSEAVYDTSRDSAQDY
jgi:hypothetical protein